MGARAVRSGVLWIGVVWLLIEALGDRTSHKEAHVSSGDMKSARMSVESTQGRGSVTRRSRDEGEAVRAGRHPRNGSDDEARGGRLFEVRFSLKGGKVERDLDPWEARSCRLKGWRKRTRTRALACSLSEERRRGGGHRRRLSSAAPRSGSVSARGAQRPSRWRSAHEELAGTATLPHPVSASAPRAW